MDYVFFQELERPPKDIVTSKNGVWFKASLNIFYGFGTIFSVISLNAFKMTEISEINHWLLELSTEGRPKAFWNDIYTTV